MRSVYSVAVGPPGTLYIADLGNSRIREVSPAGTISTVAGNGDHGFSGDGGPATSAELDDPEGVVAGANGFYILDAENYRVRFVSATGVISSIAGDGFDNYSGDNGPAVRAQIADPEGVTVLPSGNLLIADTENFAIRQVNSAGIMTTVAGNETYGYSGDNGPAVNAQLGYPSGIATDSAGNFYIADSSNYAVRKVSNSGTITTIAGGNGFGYSGNGGPATAAQLSNMFSSRMNLTM
jgi:sugar lactone lactonase YvrE